MMQSKMLAFSWDTFRGLTVELSDAGGPAPPNWLVA
jgi:hypothetical protein